MAGNSLGDLFVRIKGDTTDFDKSVDKTKKGVDKFATGTGAIAKSLKGLIAGVGLAALAIKIGELGKASILAASDAQETQNKFDVVFSGISDAANDMAIQLAGAYGLSIQGAKDMLAGTGDLLTGLGFTQESAFSLSEQVLTLGADLASFTNYSGGAEGASEALTKALLGEREMLKGLGISINEADLKAEVLRQTQSGLTFETEKQAKANATLTLVMNQSKNAMGDFERSQDSFANQSKIAAAAVSDLQVEIGRRMLPAATIATSAFGELTSAVADFLRESKNLSDAEEALEAGTETADQRLLVLRDETKELNLQLKIKKSSFEDLKKSQQLAEIDQKVFIDQINLLEGQIAARERSISGIQIERAEKQRLLDLTEDERLAEEELQKQKQERYDAGVKAVLEQDILVQAVIEAGKGEIELIDEQIAALQTKTLAEGQYYDDQQAAIALLQAEKKAILDEEITLEAEKRETLRQGEQDLANEIYAIGLKQAADKEAFRLEEIEGRREAAQFIQDSASNIASIIKNFDTAELNDIENNKNAKIAALQTEEEGNVNFAAQKVAIEKEAANKIYEIELAQFNTKKALALSQIAIDTAIGVAKVYGQTGIFGLGAQVPVIAMGVAQAAVVLSEPAPARPQLATGAVIAGSQRGVDVTVAEGGNGEIIQGMGSQGAALRAQLANETADVLMARGAMGGVTNINLNGNGIFSKRDLDDFARKVRPSLVKEDQRLGIGV